MSYYVNQKGCRYTVCKPGISFYANKLGNTCEWRYLHNQINQLSTDCGCCHSEASSTGITLLEKFQEHAQQSSTSAEDDDCCCARVKIVFTCANYSDNVSVAQSSV